MALINCPECGKEISDTCKACIHCGYSLQTSPLAMVEIAKKQFNAGEVFAKYKKPIIAILSVIVLLVVVISISSANANRDPLEKLYNGQTRDSVRKVLGTPDEINNLVPGKFGSSNSDVYNKVNLLGKSGRVFIGYDADNLLDYVIFKYDLPYNSEKLDEGPSSKDRDEAREYALSLIAHYTEKYGTPDNDPYPNTWHLPDGMIMGLEFDSLSQKYSNVIEIILD